MKNTEKKQPLVQVKNLCKYFEISRKETLKAVDDLTFDIYKGETVSLVGESGCGKSTLLKSLNRMNDLVEGCRISGDIKLDGVDIYKDKMDVNVLRKRVGMVFQKPNPFPMSIYDYRSFWLTVISNSDRSRCGSSCRRHRSRRSCRP